ncbi:MAG: hypothetical protein V1678_00700 [Candidatus Aenigmatarchaeota archaeon]
MDKVFLASISLILLFIISGIALKTTGFVIGDAEVGIKETVLGKITGVDYKSAISVSEIQNITAEFTNIGSVPITSRTEITIYFYNSTRLEPIANYYDSYVILQPGQKRVFKASFMSPYYGTYYVKIKVPYETKVTEVWGVFSMTYIVPIPAPIIIVVPPMGEGTWIYEKGPGIPMLTADFQKNYDLTSGQTVLININANNTGEVPLSSLRLSTSTTNLIITDVNPKVLNSLDPGESTVFLVSVEMPKDMPPGIYPLGFEILSDKARTSGSISLNITSAEKSIKDDVYNTILNYEYLINDLESKILDADSKGQDVTLAQKSFDSARKGLDRAKEYYDSGGYEEARDKLDEVRQDIEDVVFQLANSELNLYVTPAFSPFILLIILIVLGIIFFIILRRRRSDRKPRLLREASLET